MKWFKDQDDLEIVLTDDPIINIIGTKGSGKTTTSLKYFNDQYIVINCDRLFDLPSNEVVDPELNNIKKMLLDKYQVIPNNQDFINCYYDIIKYIIDNNKKGIIEGNVIQDIEPSLLKGTIIVKRTAILKSYRRAVKRDYHNQHFMDLEKEKHRYLYKLIRLYKIANRRKNIINQAKDIDIIISELDKIKK